MVTDSNTRVPWKGAVKFNIVCYLRWFTLKPTRTLEYVPIPPLRGDEFHTMTVLPYLMEYHYGDDSAATENHTEYITEHELNGKIEYFVVYLLLLSIML
jgi:hypothetical protein